jgi:hypothetical protein
VVVPATVRELTLPPVKVGPVEPVEPVEPVTPVEPVEPIPVGPVGPTERRVIFTVEPAFIVIVPPPSIRKFRYWPAVSVW